MEKILAALANLGLTAKVHEHEECTSHEEHVRSSTYTIMQICLLNMDGYASLCVRVYPNLEQLFSLYLQTEALQHQDGIVAKTVLLTDKKGRVYVCICHPDTAISCKFLSSRLGVGKGGIKDAAESLKDGLFGSSSSHITLASMISCQYAFGVLIDHSLCVEFWIGAAHGKGSIYLDAVHVSQLLSDRPIQTIDFSSDPKIDRDNPPDLKQFADSLETLPKEMMENAKSEAPAPKKEKASKKVKSKSSSSKSTVTDVNALASSLIQLISDTYTKDEEAKRRARADVIMQLNILRNTSYAEGFKASKV